MNEILTKRIEEAADKHSFKYLSQDRIEELELECHYNAGFIEGAEYALSHQWISVEEYLPEYDESVIVAFGDDDYALLHRSNNSNVLTDKNGFCNYGYKEVLAWMPIPKFKTEEKKGKR